MKVVKGPSIHHQWSHFYTHRGLWLPFSSVLWSQTVSAQRHLAATEVPAGAKASVFGGVSCTAEEERLTLEAALPSKYRKRRKDVVDFRVYHVTLHLQPGRRHRKSKGLKGLTKLNDISSEGGILQRVKTYREEKRNIFATGSKGNW